MSVATIGFAQQATQYSMYMLNQSQFNPAFAGMSGALEFNGVFRRQWAGLTGSPSQQVLTAHMPLYFLSSGVGLVFENDLIGARQYSKMNLQWSYQLPMGSATLSLGASAGLTQLIWDGSKLRTPGGTYDGSIFSHEDDILPTSRIGGLAPNFGVGVFYKTEQLELSLSANNISESSIVLDEAQLYLPRHLFFYASYKYDLTGMITLQPSVMVKSELVNYQTDVSARFIYDDQFFFGGGFRGFNPNSFDAIGIMGGWQVNQRLQIAYNYDISISEISDVNDGSHEILLKYRVGKEFGKGKLPKVIYNPRFY